MVLNWCSIFQGNHVWDAIDLWYLGIGDDVCVRVCVRSFGQKDVSA